MDPSLAAFAETLRTLDAEADLGRLALTVARVEYPALDPAPWLDRLDDLARRSGVGGRGGRGLERLVEFLFVAEGFRGDTEDYYDPRNSCLNEVLERRLGIPITLAVLLMEVGRRCGVALDGIGLPGHFLVGARLGGERLLLDPFAGGRTVTRADAEALAAKALGRSVTLAPAHLAPASPRQIVLRMLRNLQGIYARRGDWAKALAVLDRLMLVAPEEPAHRREREAALGRYRRALAQLN
jgi:regulator of sirC expression with transglutaminase-like and TPR domain